MTTHIVPLKIYVTVFVSLLVLLALTVTASYVPLGRFNVVIALTIAIAKMFLVMLFFMHVRYSGQLIWIYVGISFFWLAILLALTMSDSLTRYWPPFLGR